MRKWKERTGEGSKREKKRWNEGKRNKQKRGEQPVVSVSFSLLLYGGGHQCRISGSGSKSGCVTIVVATRHFLAHNSYVNLQASLVKPSSHPTTVGMCMNTSLYIIYSASFRTQKPDLLNDLICHKFILEINVFQFLELVGGIVTGVEILFANISHFFL